jgi:hypothetical protein
LDKEKTLWFGGRKGCPLPSHILSNDVLVRSNVFLTYVDGLVEETPTYFMGIPISMPFFMMDLKYAIKIITPEPNLVQITIRCYEEITNELKIAEKEYRMFEVIPDDSNGDIELNAQLYILDESVRWFTDNLVVFTFLMNEYILDITPEDQINLLDGKHYLVIMFTENMTDKPNAMIHIRTTERYDGRSLSEADRGVLSCHSDKILCYFAREGRFVYHVDRTVIAQKGQYMKEDIKIIPFAYK